MIVEMSLFVAREGGGSRAREDVAEEGQTTSR